jgi:hypothetical protein
MGTHFLGGLNMRPVTVPDGTTYKVLVKDSGKLHVMPNLTANCTITLPFVENGLKYEFMYAGAADDAQNWIIVTSATDELFKGGVTQLDPAEATLTEVVPVYADFSNDDTFTVITPNTGTSVTFVSDGVSWLTNGIVVSDTPPTFA